MDEIEDIEAFMTLRLTLLQAKVYLAIVRLEEAKIREISKSVKVARQDIYRVVAELQNLGLVEKVIATPYQYQAIPIRQAVFILLKRIQENDVESQEEAMKVIERHKKEHKTANTLEKEHKFVMIPERAALLLRLNKSVESSQISIDITCSWRTCVQALFDLLPVYRRALDRGVKIRWVVYTPLDQDAMPENIKELLENSLFELRFLPCNQAQRLAIYDTEEVYVASYPERGFIESPALWSNAAPLIKLVQNYFDMLWHKATGVSLGK